VNKLRECPLYPNLLVTHTDSPYLYVWNSERDLLSGERNSDDTTPDIADLILVGHQQVAEYALALSSAEPKVASGGHDHNVSSGRLHRNFQISALTGFDLELD